MGKSHSIKARANRHRALTLHLLYVVTYVREVDRRRDEKLHYSESDLAHDFIQKAWRVARA